MDVSEPARPPGLGSADFDAIYDRELEYVCRTLGRFGVPAADLLDAAQEVFLVLYRKWRDIDTAKPMRPWLFGVARRVAADLRAKRREEPVPVEQFAADPQFAQRDLLWRALDALDDDRRTVVILHDLEGHTGAEIATLLELPVNTVHSRLRLARADLVAVVRRLKGAP